MVETTSTTNTLTLPVPGALKRCAIIGTAQSWARCPWQDQTLEVWGLNDAYLIGVPRADRWYDLHPFHQMAFRPKDQRTVRQQDVPIGAYLRPDGHLDWLRTRPMPVYLAEARPDFPTARAFPQAEILEWFKPYWPYRLTRHGRVEPGPDYEVSTPAWMLMHAIVEGYGEIHVYGIHLATQWEYVQQRPNFEFLLGLAAGRGIKIVLPQAAPICQARYRYAFEPKADLPIQSAQLTIDQIKAEGLALHQQRAALPWYARGRKQDVARQLARADLLLADARQQLTRAQIRQMA
jgi:hypothetical protein